MQIYQCPDCATALDDLTSCGGCGLVFRKDGDKPVAFPTKPRNFNVTIDVTKPPSVDDAIFRYPPRSGQRGTKTYHLDIAHADILTSLPRDSLMLEIGCGGGQMRTWAREVGLRYLGTDVSETRVYEWLREYGGADLFCDAHSLPFTDASIDVVYASAVWEHLAFPQLAMQEAARVIRPGGYMIGSVSFLEPWHDDSYFHMTPYGIYMCLTLAGLQPLHIWPEVDWPGFKAVLKMGNKATQPLGLLGQLMNAYYLAPKAAQVIAQTRRLPSRGDLFLSRAKVSGANAWIARKPENDEAKLTGNSLG